MMVSVMRAMVAALAMLAFGVAFAAEPKPGQAQVRTENVVAEIVSAQTVARPGEAFYAALRLEVRPEWHTYWRNPGDSGSPTTLLWRPAQGFAFGELIWPTPHALPLGPLTNYGFEGETLYPFTVTVPADAPSGPVRLTADGEWLVCKDICIFEDGALTLSFEIGAAAQENPAWAARIQQALDEAPKPAAGVQARITAAGDLARLTVAGGPLQGAAVRNVAFFPFEATAIDHAAPQEPQRGPQGVQLTLKPAPGSELGAAPLSGVLAFETDGPGGVIRRGLEITADPGEALAGVAGTPAGPPGAAQSGGAASGLTFFTAAVFAFLGGLLLNVMPCVFPVLSLKALSLAGGAHDAGGARRHGLVFFAGVMATFAALGGVLVALQAAGAAAGWGFQLQEPLVIGGLAALFFAIGLNLLGAFELGGGLQNLGSGLAGRSGDLGAFFTGALAVVAATPCTAPFMAGALGFAAAQPPVVAMGVFASLGLGFAAPMVGLSFAPGLLRLLPKPGPWMETLKQFFAFPMFATTVWLAWVLAGQAGPAGLLVLLSTLTAFAFLVWLLRAEAGPRARIAGIALAAALVGAVVYVVRPQSTALVAEPWSAQRVAELTAAGQPVFVNFTADWCVTCKVNERTSLSSAEVARAFADAGVTYLKGDWTARDDDIAAALAAHGRNGVPLYLLYRPGASAPEILPQLLTPGIVIAAIEAAGEGAERPLAQINAAEAVSP